MPIFLTVFSFFLSFFFFMAALVYVIESRVVFHLLREKVEFTGYTTETMKMTTVTWNGNSTHQMWWNDPRLFKIFGELKIWSLILNNSC